MAAPFRTVGPFNYAYLLYDTYPSQSSHIHRLMPNMRRREKVCGTLAVIGAFIGGAGLILLSIFDTKRFTSLHRLFLLIFMVGVALSAIFTIVEVSLQCFKVQYLVAHLVQYRWISKDFKYVHELRVGYLTKAVIAGILIVLAIAFAITLYTRTQVGGS
jgi:hypothetical protein